LKKLQQTAKTDIRCVEVEHRICLVCGACVGICSANAMFLENASLTISSELCTRCGRCVQICPVRALLQRAEQV
jgi:ferredoxin